jgi:O-6-methylguanine DNA methyltransferase
MKVKAQKNPPKRISWGVVSSPAGKLLVGLTEKGAICRVSFLGRRNVIDAVEEWQRDWPRSSFTIGKVPKDFMKLPLLMIGTEFQKNAWQEIRRIPRGQIASYGEIARRIGAPRSARAVGTACGKNYLAYIVPCHRVVAANGIGGYGPGGTDTKKALLKAEGITAYGLRPRPVKRPEQAFRPD